MVRTYIPVDLARRVREAARSTDPALRKELYTKARVCFEKSLEIEPGYSLAAEAREE
jgi:hypothetical protein